jgi:2-(1,2-epoxy-1,2-dihydrophenyl)acetyl-CoA isomerase
MTTTARPYDDFVADARADERPLVAIERADTHAIVRLDDPSSLNALSAPLTLQLHDALRALAAEPRLRTIVLTGADPAFSAGGDLKLMQDYAHPVAEAADEGIPALWRWIRGEFGGIARLITRTDKTFVAAVNGAAAGVGLAFALACDVILVSERARIVPAFGRIGLLPEVGNSWLLTRRLGYQGAYALFASGRHLSGAEALELGLANELVGHDELLGAARAWCARIDDLPDHVARMMKPLLRATTDLSWEQAITLEEFAEPGCFTTRTHRDAVQALVSHA